MSHARKRIGERLGILDASIADWMLMEIEDASSRGDLNRLSETSKPGRTIYAYTLSNGLRVYPIIADADQFIVTVLSPGMNVATMSGWIPVDDLDFDWEPTQ